MVSEFQRFQTVVQGLKFSGEELISRRRSKPQCGSINLCNPFARSAGIFSGLHSLVVKSF